MNTGFRNHALLRRLALVVLAALFLDLLVPLLVSRAQPPVIDFGQIPTLWGGSGLGYWTRPEEIRSTGRTGYIGRLNTGEMVENGEEKIYSGADLSVEYGVDVRAGFGERVTAGVESATLSDGRKVNPQVKVTEGEFYGYRATIVEIIYTYPSYSYTGGGFEGDGVQERWEGGSTFLRRVTCFEARPSGPCTTVREAISAYTSPAGALGENAERDAYNALADELDAWKATWTITGSKQVERTLTVTGYDGTDTVHMPLTFALKAEENGQPLANESISFRFLGDVTCLADEYATWDAGSQSWQPVTQNLAVDQNLQAVTDAKGELKLRTVLDFGRMRLFGKKLPCTIELYAAMAAKPAENDTLIEQRTSVTIRHPVFIRDVFFLAAKDPTGNSRWIRANLLDKSPYDQYVVTGYGRRLDVPAAAYPGSWEVVSRVYVAAPGSSEYASLKPPATETDYFYPLAGGSKLLISLHDDLYCGTCGANMQPGDGIAVAVMWADGVNGLFSERFVNDKAAEVMFGDGSQYGVRTSEESEWTRFAISQGTDVLVKGGLVLGATWLGGPAAGAWTALIVETWQSTADMSELVEMGISKKLVTFRSEASLTGNPDGSITLYNFAGSPSVTDEAGNEVFAGEGEAVNFAYDGPIQPAVAQEAPPAALDLQAVLSQEPGPTGGAVEPPVDAVPESGGGSVEPPVDAVPESSRGAVELPVAPGPESSDDTRWPLLVCGGLVGILVAGALVVIGTRSRKKRQAPSPRPRPAGASGPVPVEIQRPPADAALCPHCGSGVRPEGGVLRRLRGAGGAGHPADRAPGRPSVRAGSDRLGRADRRDAHLPSLRPDRGRRGSLLWLLRPIPALKPCWLPQV